MKQIKKEVKSLTKELKALTQKTEKIVKAFENLDKDQVKSKSVKKAAKPKKVARKPVVKKIIKKPTQITATKGTVVGAVMKVIKASKKGVNVSQIMKQTSLNKGQIWPAISRAKKEGKVKIVKKGIYVGV